MRSLVIPVYRNEETIGPLLERLETLYSELEGDLEVVFVVDGSPDRSHEMLEEGLSKCSFPAELISLSRNFGSFAAIRMGLAAARGPRYAVMAADLQEPPELITEFFRSLREEPVDIVVGQRTQRSDPIPGRWFSAVFWWLYRCLVQKQMPSGGIDVFACGKPVRDALLNMPESHSSLVGQLIWLGFRRKTVPYQRQPRFAGKSTWTFRKKVRYMFDSIYSFTDLPIICLTLMGASGLGITLVVSAMVLVEWLRGRIPVLGYTPLMLVILFSTFLLLTGIGIIGNYVWRTFENSKGRPLVVPMRQKSFRKEKES